MKFDNDMLTMSSSLIPINFNVKGSIILSLIICLLTIDLDAQPKNEILKSVNVYKVESSIKLDGVFDEAIWSKAIPAADFKQNFPSDSARATNDTEVRLAFDKDNLYVAVKCYSQGRHLITPSLRRDFDFFGNDNISVLFDTYSDNTNALIFGMTPFGVRREATISNAGQGFGDFDESWDNKWDGAAKIYDDYWAVEMAIPFKTLRFSKGSQKWRFNSYRYDTQSNEITTWIDIPTNRIVMDLSFMGNMNWETPLENPGKNISIIPYLAVNSNRNFEDASELSTQNNLSVGGDAKISVSSGLNLDLTVNPDFSQVEVDEQVTNLDRFEIFFPEKRQFFLENADLFSSFGGTRVNPFFSRRIGVSIDPNTGQNIQNTIHYGARLSGKVNDDLRIGILNMQTASQEENGLPAFNFSVASADQRISKYSRVAGIFVNKQSVNTGDLSGDFNNYNRVLGLEYRLNSPDNTWTGQASYMKSFTPGISEATDAHILQLVHTKRKYRLEWAHVYVGNGFNTEVGFTPRRDYLLLSPEAQINFFPESGPISRQSIGFDSRVFYKIGQDDNEVISDFSVQEYNFEPFWNASFKNGGMLNVSGSFTSLTLLNDFDPTRVQSEDIFLPAGSKHSFANLQGGYQSDRRTKLNYSIGLRGGSFYSGSIFGANGSFTYRYQPFGFISLNYSYFRIALDDPFETTDLWLVGPRVDVTFSKSVFLTTFIQYNNQLDNVNINTRFQWRFAPVSDLFIVYTDNYSTDPLIHLPAGIEVLLLR